MKKILFTLNPPKNINSMGGGNYFVENLIYFLEKNNFKVIFNIEENIDLIIIIDPLKKKKHGKNYSLEDIINYKKKYPNTKILYRVNDCDKKRNYKSNTEDKMVEAIKASDYTVFISQWLKNYYFEKFKLNINNYSIFYNGVNKKYFYKKKNSFIKNENKIKIVTHHHSDNYLKGFHIYNEIDKILNTNKSFEFTFIGNYNKEYTPNNIKLLKPCNGIELGNLLRNYDIYLTASQYEPCGMHHIEGLSCGLPILYCTNSGGIQEVCKIVGEEFHDINSMLEKMELIKNNYGKYIHSIKYKYLSSDRCCKEYLNLINELLE